MSLVKTLYKGLLKASRRLDAVAPSTVDELARFALPPGMVVGPSVTTTQQFVRDAFRSSATVKGTPMAASLLDCALSALPTANARVAALEAAELHQDLHDADKASEASSTLVHMPRYSVGQVFRHARYGYRAVIIGYDSTCRAGPQWATRTGVHDLPRRGDQPFFHVLVDVRDRPDAQIAYVAEDNIGELMSRGLLPRGGGNVEAPALATAATTSTSASDAALGAIVIHPLVPKYFSTFVPAGGFFVPGDELAMEYPADAAATTMAAAALASMNGARGGGSGETGGNAGGGDPLAPPTRRSIAPRQ